MDAIVREKIVVNIIGEIFAGAKIREMPAGLRDGQVAFQVALHADSIAPRGRNLCGIDDRAA